MLASGSLDHEVRLWDANTAECITFFDFGKPIASLAFHSDGGAEVQAQARPCLLESTRFQILIV